MAYIQIYDSKHIEKEQPGWEKESYEKAESKEEIWCSGTAPQSLRTENGNGHLDTSTLHYIYIFLVF